MCMTEFEWHQCTQSLGRFSSDNVEGGRRRRAAEGENAIRKRKIQNRAKCLPINLQTSIRFQMKNFLDDADACLSHGLSEAQEQEHESRVVVTNLAKIPLKEASIRSSLPS